MNNDRNSAQLEAGGGKGLEKPPQQHIAQRLQTQESLLFQNDPGEWIARVRSDAVIKALCNAESVAKAESTDKEFFFTRYLQFFREGRLFEIPFHDDWIIEWAALAFESAFDLATEDREQAAEWLENSPTERHIGNRHFAFYMLRRDPRKGERGFVFTRDNLIKWHENSEKRPASVREEEWLVQKVEEFFWAGIYAATVASETPEMNERAEWFASESVNGWGDPRHHTRIVRKAPLCGNHRFAESLDHPLLRIAADKYTSSPLEGSVIKAFLESQCIKYGFNSEKDHVGSDLVMGAWVRDAYQFGRRLVKENPELVEQVIQTTGQLSGAELKILYGSVLSGVKDKTDPFALTFAFLKWCGDLRHYPVSRYFGEKLTTVLICVDAAIWLPWTYRTKKASIGKKPSSRKLS